MSSYGHHTTSSSFPADYGLLAAARNANPNEDDNLNESLDDSTRSNYIRPTNPSMATVKRKSSAVSLSHERTPLLAPSVPRIHEELPQHTASEGRYGRFAVYVEELGILSKYTLPVFG